MTKLQHYVEQDYDLELSHSGLRQTPCRLTCAQLKSCAQSTSFRDRSVAGAQRELLKLIIAI